MPPKKGKKGDEPPVPSQPLVRPSTPNDFQIVATVKSLQQLVNTETKWKNRLKDAQRLNSIANAKIAKLHQMIDQCRSGIAMLDREVEDLIAALAVSGSASFTSRGAAAGGAGGGLGAARDGVGASAPAAPPGPSKKGGGGAKDEEIVPPEAVARRQEQSALMGLIIRAYYSAKRLSRDRRPPRPASTVEMESEFSEALRLSTPVAELMTLQHGATSPSPGAGGKPLGSGAPGGGAKKGAATPGAGQGRKDTVTSLGAGALEDSAAGDLAAEDVQQLPLPKGVDPELMELVLGLRSRRLRLEASIEIFERELKPLHKRLEGVESMTSVGNYSIAAVTPKIQEAVAEEAALQRVRQQEDEMFAKKAETKRTAHK